MEKIVLQRFIANSGFCSRRKAEELIGNGEVLVNDKIAELGMKVSVDDMVEISGKRIDLPKDKIYIIFNKPLGVTCTNRGFLGERNVFYFLPKEFGSLHIVGRLDKNSSGLLLLTNDGDYTLMATHPRYGHEKKYIVEIGKLKMDVWELLDMFKQGVDIGDGDGIVLAKSIRYLGDNRFEIILTEGKKRQIRRMFGALGLDVADLKRVAIGNILLGDLREGEWRKINLKA